MGVLDQAIVPTQSAPSSTSDATLYTAAADTVLIATVTNIDSGNGSLAVRVGVTPSGGSVHWKYYDIPIPFGNPIELGPISLRNGDAITVRTNTINDAVFSVTGWRSS